ncbi:hypothetical protein V6Z11_D04G102000 [Gossypium hirsutum]|uniref:Uncharacterized protein n=1 Tax=Gossypium hirsutum TaxID=3635 RepID=A0A1U8IM89_GOSHI|nr:uncharacterized protein LOC107898200 [Gossypium hirsutum]
MSFLTTMVVRQSKSDHEPILMNTLGSKQGERYSDPRTWFKYDVCWAKEHEARDIITRIWTNKESNILDKMDKVREELGPWQHQRYKRMKNKINRLENKICTLMDGPNSERSTNLLKFACCKLGYLYAMDENYWAQRDRIQWLKEGDRNTRYFHVRATGRKKKNSI